MKNITKIIKDNWQLIVVVVCIIGFLLIAEDVINKDLMKGDVIGYGIISKFLINEKMTPIMKFIANLGGGIFVIALTLILAVSIKNKKVSLSIIINLVTITVLNQALKYSLQRPRPTGFRLAEATGFSFPSGHSMISLAFYGYLIYLIYKYIKNTQLKYILMSLLTVLICLIGISRIYLGVHYTSDVLGGFLLSIAYIVLYIYIAKKYIIKDVT